MLSYALPIPCECKQMTTGTDIRRQRKCSGFLLLHAAQLQCCSRYNVVQHRIHLVRTQVSVARWLVFACSLASYLNGTSKRRLLVVGFALSVRRKVDSTCLSVCLSFSCAMSTHRLSLLQPQTSPVLRALAHRCVKAYGAASKPAAAAAPLANKIDAAAHLRLPLALTCVCTQVKRTSECMSGRDICCQYCCRCHREREREGGACGSE